MRRYELYAGRILKSAALLGLLAWIALWLGSLPVPQPTGAAVAVQAPAEACPILLKHPRLDADGYPEPTNQLVDEAGVISPEDECALNRKLAAMDDGRRQFGVAVVRTLGDRSVEEYAVKLFEKWGVGSEGRDDGALVLISVGERKVRLEIGYGLEGDIPDAAAGRIIRDDMAPRLKAGDWSGGVNVALDKMAERVK